MFCYGHLQLSPPDGRLSDGPQTPFPAGSPFLDPLSLSSCWEGSSSSSPLLPTSANHFPPSSSQDVPFFQPFILSQRTPNLHLRFAAHRDATQCHSQSPAHWGRGQGQARSIQARGVTDTGGECSGAPAQPCTPGEPAENQLCGAVGAIPRAGLPAGDRTCEHEHGNTSCRGRGKLCQPGWPLWLGMEKGWGGERALQHGATAWLPKGQSAEPTDSFLGRAHFLSEQPGSPKDGLDELLARYRHQGAPGNTEHTGREIGDRTSPPALLATHRRLQARTGGAVHGREVGGLPVVPRCASHPHAPPVRPGASRRVLHPHPIPSHPSCPSPHMVATRSPPQRQPPGRSGSSLSSG